MRRKRYRRKMMKKIHAPRLLLLAPEACTLMYADIGFLKTKITTEFYRDRCNFNPAIPLI